jgi:hypothetical protein
VAGTGNRFGVTADDESRVAASLGLIGIDRRMVVRPPTGVHHVVRDATERGVVPTIDHLEDQR